jgi:hypothetical protein
LDLPWLPWFSQLRIKTQYQNLEMQSRQSSQQPAASSSTASTVVTSRSSYTTLGGQKECHDDDDDDDDTKKILHDNSHGLSPSSSHRRISAISNWRTKTGHAHNLIHTGGQQQQQQQQQH